MSSSFPSDVNQVAVARSDGAIVESLPARPRLELEFATASRPRRLPGEGDEGVVARAASLAETLADGLAKSALG